MHFSLHQASHAAIPESELPLDHTHSLLAKAIASVPPTFSASGEQRLDPRAGIALGVLGLGGVVSHATLNESYAGGLLARPSNSMGAFRH